MAVTRAAGKRLSQLAPELPAQHGHVALGPRELVGHQHVALPAARRALRHAARGRAPARRALAAPNNVPPRPRRSPRRRRGRQPMRKPAGNGSVGVQHVGRRAGDPGAARDLRDHRGPPADDGLPHQPACEAGADDRLVHERCRRGPASRGRGAGPCGRWCPSHTASGPPSPGGSRWRRARRRRRRASSVQMTWWQPRMASFSGCTGSGTAAISSRPAAINAGACSGATVRPTAAASAIA